MNQAQRLEETTQALDDIRRTLKETEIKLASAEERMALERSTEFQLNFELSRIHNVIRQTKSTIETLSKEEERLIAMNQTNSLQLKRIHNYFGYICPMQLDRKAEWIQNLRGELNSLDFTIEELEEEPTRSFDTLTQVPRC